MNYVQALKVFNSKRDKWINPRKGSPEHAKVLAIMHKQSGKKSVRKKQLKKICACPLQDGQCGGSVQAGEGWFTKKVLEGRPRILNDLLKREGNKTLARVEVCRVPVNPMLVKMLNAATLGGFKRILKTRGYDAVYHLYMVVYLADGTVYSLEKNQRVNVRKGKLRGKCFGLPYGKKTLSEFILAAENRNIPGFYRYSAFRDNCQKWVKDIMNSNGITKFDEFILQDVSQLVPKWVERVANRVTDTAGVADYLIRGGGLQ